MNRESVPGELQHRTSPAFEQTRHALHPWQRQRTKSAGRSLFALKPGCGSEYCCYRSSSPSPSAPVQVCRMTTVAGSISKTARTLNDLQFVTGIDSDDETVPTIVSRQIIVH